MVLGMRGKNRRGVTVQIDFLIHIQEIKPWPPSQSLRSLRSVLIEWKNGECASGSTNLVAPSLGSVIGEGRIEFNESFRLHVTLLRDMSVRGGDADVFQKNCLEFNLYEPRRDKTVKGQLLATGVVDLAEYGALKESLSTSVPMNCKRSYRNTDQPLLFIKIRPVERNRASALLKDSNGGDSVSTLMNEEYAEEAEIASFTDDDVSSHSSVAAVSTSIESTGFTQPKFGTNEPISNNTGVNAKKHPLASERRLENMNMVQEDTHKLERSSYVSSTDVSPVIRSLVNGHASNSPNRNSLSIQKLAASPSADSSSPSSVCDNLDINPRSMTRSSGHESLGQSFHEKLANYRNIVADVQRNSNESTFGIYSKHTSSQDRGHFTSKNPGYENFDTTKCDDKLNGRCKEADKYFMKERSNLDGNERSNLDGQNYIEDEQLVAQEARDQALLGSNTHSYGESNTSMQENILKSERLKNTKSVRLPGDSVRNAELNENGILGDAQNSSGNRSNDRRDSKILAKEIRSGTLDGKIEHLEKKIKMLEGELREAAAIEAALYTVVAEHGNSTSKVHAPARRLSRLYLHASKENLQERRAGAAKSSVSGLVLVTKACGNDVPRLTFWLSNTIVLRTIISQTVKVPPNPAGSGRRKKTEGEEGCGKITTSLRVKGLYPRKTENTALGYEGFGNWDDPHIFILALEKVEAWIFSRIIESIWWQTLTPHMQHTMVTNKEVMSATRKDYRRTSSSCDQKQGNLSLYIWKNAFREACERVCPIRARGHECGCLSMLSRLIMEQCVARLDVAMFNAILRESADDIPTDPVSDAISDPNVLPIPPGKSSFGAGAQLKTVIGTWSRWLTDLFGMDDVDSIEDKADPDHNEERENTFFKSFSILNALSDLLMLPKDMLLSASIRNEVCPMFNATLIKKILDNFVPDELCPDPVPSNVFEALNSENEMEDGKEYVNNFPCIAAPIAYSPPPATSIASIVGEIGSKSQLRRNKSSVVRKSHTSDDELDELKSPLSSIFFSVSSSPKVLTKSSLKFKEIRNQSPVRYELLRDVWMKSD
ncbi:hypothetical protein AAZX31_19G067400 [Glycine max]|uniref:C2 NT-type domain-containing protein n=1 Tax=Glycine max TaxID=3847 RepID=K7MX46_SOYBN|nr:uncharacterized protein LOC100818584 [Glycine max]XP_040868856.1 uncharacterized protein LOC100818584 [Glycine max]XP_040868857.1 uncharacterized protein LOC100818584 [Glycine max]KAG4915234.1 hypothetical protein JHK87_052791 [Glycine soja]KAG4395929.1 hypothetical protein GLYMA_19G074600v4 [Glycine max]KAG4912275.1 hypothetical protein JHK86_052708 [Glycine max]KAG4927076.1 hypothetical protein JHK85_053562 [Glycine max]KAG5082699.1 hypothetical protein JHK84_052737 [Glycine max]|eukprot:XP_006604088.1 uncharacterized protein LOC100818584 [Glycine max]